MTPSRGPELEPLDVLRAGDVQRWYSATLESFGRHRKAINALNVYPVPDGDTGTNMRETMRAACAQIESTDDTSLPEITHSAARGALLGAHGNSGVILAQVLRGFADAWGTDTIDSALFAAGLRRAAAIAADAIAVPTAGTILSVIRSAADSASRLTGTDLPHMVTETASHAAVALKNTTNQLAALTRAGVVDAGGFGFALMLDALVTVVTGKPSDYAEQAVISGSGPKQRTSASLVVRETGSADYAYEVQYLLEATVESVERLRVILSGLGDSLVIIGASGGDQSPTWNVHVHVNNPGAAIEAGIEAGRPYRVSITRFADEQPGTDVDVPSRRHVVMILDSPGLQSIVTTEHSSVLLASSDLCVSDIEIAIRDGASEEVIVVTQTTPETCETAADRVRQDNVRIAVIPVRSPVQALAALAVAQPERRFDDDVIAMAEAAGACRSAQVTVAERESLTSVGRCQPGDLLGHVDGDVVLIGQNMDEVLTGLADRMCAAGAELVTVVPGDEIPDLNVERLLSHVAQSWPMVEIQLLKGGQYRPLLWIGAE